jgi:hypothetical protein
MSASARLKKLSEEHRRKISIATAKNNTGRKMSAETRRKISESLTGRTMPPRSDETRQRLSESLLGVPKSAEHRQKIREANLTKDPTYKAIHIRLTKTYGPASFYQCVDCGNQAQQWSYDNTDDQVRIDPAIGCAYSFDLFRYQSRCVPCHVKYDKAVRDGSLYVSKPDG